MNEYAIEKFQWDSKEYLLHSRYMDLGLKPYDEIPQKIVVVGKTAKIVFKFIGGSLSYAYAYDWVKEIMNPRGFPRTEILQIRVRIDI
jgi:hypothetical protein